MKIPKCLGERFTLNTTIKLPLTREVEDVEDATAWSVIMSRCFAWLFHCHEFLCGTSCVPNTQQPQTAAGHLGVVAPHVRSFNLRFESPVL